MHRYSDGPFDLPPILTVAVVIITARVEVFLTAAGWVGVFTAHDGGGDLVVVLVGTRPKMVNIVFIIEFRTTCRAVISMRYVAR